MKLVVADTSPINYLLIIGLTSVLPALFHRVILRTAVAMNSLLRKLRHSYATG